jgi:hypothetical protein
LAFECSSPNEELSVGLNSPTSETCDTGNPRIAQETPTNVETNAMQVKRTNRLMMRTQNSRAT